MTTALDTLEEEFNISSVYLHDLSKRIYRSAVIFVVCFIVGFFIAGYLIRTFLGFLHLENVTMIVTSPFQIASLALDFGLSIALLVTFPYLLYNLFAFVFPGLTVRERRMLLLLIPGSVFLFCLGFLYGTGFFYFGMNAIANLNIHLGIQNMWDITLFFSEIFLTSSLLGALFQFPLFLIFLIKLNVLSTEVLIEKRKLAIFTIFLLVSLLPPTDGLSLIVMSMPLVALYEITILFNNKKQHAIWTRI